MSFHSELREILANGRDEAVIARRETVEDSRQFVGPMFNERTEALSPVYLALCEALAEQTEDPSQGSCECNGGCNCFVPK